MDRKLLVLLVLVALLGAGAFVLGSMRVPSSGLDEWPVPAWVVGDRISVASGPDPSSPRFRYDAILSGPFPVMNERGETVQAVRWHDARSGLPLAPPQYFDLSEGRGVRLDASGLGRVSGVEAEEFWLGPLEGGSEGVAMQGTTLKQGDVFAVPRIWSGAQTVFQVREISATGALVEATFAGNLTLPFFEVEPDQATSTRYEIQYSEPSPYPHEIRAYLRNGTSSVERLSNVIRVVGSELAEGDRRVDREPSRAQEPLPRPGFRFSSWSLDLSPSTQLGTPFDVGEIMALAKRDSLVQDFLTTHRNARLVDLRHGVFAEWDGTRTARAWNLTWYDDTTDQWYSFVRVRYAYPMDLPLGILPNQPRNDTFLGWKTGQFNLPILGTGPVIRAPDLEPADARAAYEALHEAMPQPVFFRWTQLTAGGLTGGVLEHDALYARSSASGWNLAWGRLEYRLDEQTGETTAASYDIAQAWIVSSTGEIVRATVPAD